MKVEIHAVRLVAADFHITVRNARVLRQGNGGARCDNRRRGHRGERHRTRRYRGGRKGADSDAVRPCCHADTRYRHERIDGRLSSIGRVTDSAAERQVVHRHSRETG